MGTRRNFLKGLGVLLIAPKTLEQMRPEPAPKVVEPTPAPTQSFEPVTYTSASGGSWLYFSAEQ